MRSCHRLTRLVLCVLTALVAAARLYSGQCALCHGPNGDQVADVNLHRGQSRRASSDEDPRRIISVGIPGTGMPPFKFQPAELDGNIAFIRAGFDPSGVAVKVGDATRGQTLFAGKGGVCHLSSAEWRRTPCGPRSSDIGAVRTPATLHRSLVEPSEAMLPIAPHRGNRINLTQDGRPLRRYKRRWKVERLFAWLQTYRRLVTRYERRAANFAGFLHLACAIILLRHL
jgi:mono/diheme cytochrome c family protein